MPEISVQHQCTDLTDLIDAASFGEPVGPLRCRPEGSATRHGVTVFTKVFSFVHGSVCRRDQVFHIVAVVRGAVSRYNNAGSMLAIEVTDKA